MFGDEDALCSGTPAAPMDGWTIASDPAPLNGADGRALRARNWRYHAAPQASLLALDGAMTYSVSFAQLGDELARAAPIGAASITCRRHGLLLGNAAWAARYAGVSLHVATTIIAIRAARRLKAST